MGIEVKSSCPNEDVSVFFFLLSAPLNFDVIHSGYSRLEGDHLFVSNLSDGIDLYSLRTMQRIRHYEHTVKVNVPLQIALARQVLDWVVMGGDNGFVSIYERATGERIHHLEHKIKGRVQVVDVSEIAFISIVPCVQLENHQAISNYEKEVIAVSSTNLNQKSVIQLWYWKKGSNTPQVISLFLCKRNRTHEHKSDIASMWSYHIATLPISEVGFLVAVDRVHVYSHQHISLLSFHSVHCVSLSFRGW